MNLFSPPEITQNYIALGKKKANNPIEKMFVLAIIAGAFIALGGLAAATAAVGVTPASVGKLISGVIFPGGLTMVLLAGSELFTGNCLLTIPLLEKEITVGQMLRNWVVVYTGNMVGAFLVAISMAYSNQFSMFDNGVAVSVLYTASSKCTISFGVGLIRGIFCNFLVCIAVWLSFAAKDIAGKIIGLFFPILIFIVCGFEHSVANMYYIGAGIFAKTIPAYAEAGQAAGIDLSVINFKNLFVTNLIPVTIGNIIGGGVCVGCAYWFLYLRKAK